MPHIVMEVSQDEHEQYQALKYVLRKNKDTVKGFFLRKADQEIARLQRRERKRQQREGG